MADLKQQLQHDLTVAMRARDDVTISTLRLALAAITNAEVAGTQAVTLTDDAVLAVLRSEAKKRMEAAEIYEGAGRSEKASAERAEQAVIERYLPAAMDEDELAAIVADEVAVAATAGVTGPKAMGAVVKAVRGRVGDRADGSRIAALVKAALA